MYRDKARHGNHKKNLQDNVGERWVRGVIEIQSHAANRRGNKLELTSSLRPM